MKEPFANPPRWREHRDQSEATERIIGQDLRAIKTPTPLSGPQMARIAAGLRPVRARPAMRWLVLAASLLLGLATAASAARLHLLPRWLTGAGAPPRVAAPESRTSQRRSTPGSARNTDSAPTSEPPRLPEPLPAAAPTPRKPSSPPPAPRQVASRRDAPATAHLSAPVASPPSVQAVLPVVPVSPPVPAISPSPTVSPAPSAYLPPAHAPRVAMLDPPRPLPPKPAPESPKPVDGAGASKLLADAIRLLRADAHPQSALALLDRQATIFEQSPYRHEALLIRVESLLALKRDAELLHLLDGMPLAEVAASRTLLTTRGRLRAAAQRCTEAVADFDRVLAEPGRKNRQALLGRAQCREALGDREGAKADRERYRQESGVTPGALP
jgi:hypothetical protein